MLLRRLELLNFGLFSGVHEFDLTPTENGRHRAPIVLFGGNNGAGKTTILQAIKLCLHGRSALGNRVRQDDYRRYLVGQVHRTIKDADQSDEAAVAIEFDHVHAGERHRYFVKRSWAKSDDGKLIREDLEVSRDAQQLLDFRTEHWDDFLRELIPPSLAQLFFFDGEKIKRLARDTDNQELGESVRGLLGLDLVERLQTDLQIYLARVAAEGSSDAADRLSQLEADLRQKREDVRTLDTECRSIETLTVERVSTEIETLEAKLRSEGGAFAADRDRLVGEKARLEEIIRHAEERARDLAGRLLPFTLCTSVARRFLSELDAVAIAGDPGARGAVVADVSRILSAFAEGSLPGAGDIPSHERAKSISVLRPAFADLVGPSASESYARSKVTADLSISDQGRIRDWLRRDTPDTLIEVQQLADTVECAVRDLQAVARDLARVPSEERLRPYLSQLNSLYLELGASQEQLARLQEKLAVATRERDELVRTHTAEVEAIGQRQDLADRLELVRKVQASLSDYYARLTATRLRELGDEVTRCFNRLSRKGDMVKSIDISADTFGIRLEDTRGREIPKAALSAGEKQILAIALLWGLARVSRRPLPVIIDTPLGRLDSEHRRLLLEEYLPHASHQVIVLSTDTEVDRELFPIVAPAVARCYHLEYDRLTASTQPKAGYFWTS